MPGTNDPPGSNSGGAGGEAPKEPTEEQQQQQQPSAATTDPSPATATGVDDEMEIVLPGICGLCCACLGCLCCMALLPLMCCCAVTNEAVHRAQGKRWDNKQGKWVIDNLQEEAKTLENIPIDDDDILKLSKVEEETNKIANEAGAAGPNSAAAKKVKETKYYDALGVPPDANEGQIKRAYYVYARKWHPDKNPSDEAKTKFQAIGEAYQVLSDPKLRAVYDKEGEKGLSGDRTEVASEGIDPSLIFTFLFGNDSFNDIVGRLQLVTQTLGGGETSFRLSHEQMIELERRRVLRLALKLRERIQKYVDGDIEGAKQEWIDTGKRLVEVRYGEEILNTVGSTYKLVAIELIGTWREGMDAKVERTNMEWDATKQAIAGATRQPGGGGGGGNSRHGSSAGAGGGDNGDEGKEGGKDDDSGVAENNDDGDDELPQMIKMMWNITVIDITTTIHEVVMKVCKDMSVTDVVRKKRAQAIKELGEIWERSKSQNLDKTEKSVRHLYMSATAAAMEATLNKMQQEEQEKEKQQAAANTTSTSTTTKK